MDETRLNEKTYSDRVDLDQGEFLLDDEAYEAFVAMLDSPPPPSDELRKLLLTRPPCEEPEDRG
jgi:uncharacterized protein (DUF1778 family)